MKLGGMRVLVENTAGMGNAVGSRFEELATILEGAREMDAGVCIDTAHTFEAGYPIHTADGLEQTLERLEKTVELERVHVLHVNDSKTAFGSRVDRHEHIGKGEIGLEALGRILRHPLLSPTRVPGRAFLLETPIDLPGDDRRNVAAVWKLVGVAAEQAPDAEDGFSMVKKSKSKSESKTKSKTKSKAKSKTRVKGFAAEAQRTQRGHGERRSGGAIRKVARVKSKTKSKKRKRG